MPSTYNPTITVSRPSDLAFVNLAHDLKRLSALLMSNPRPLSKRTASNCTSLQNTSTNAEPAAFLINEGAGTASPYTMWRREHTACSMSSYKDGLSIVALWITKYASYQGRGHRPRPLGRCPNHERTRANHLRVEKATATRCLLLLSKFYEICSSTTQGTWVMQSLPSCPSHSACMLPVSIL